MKRIWDQIGSRKATEATDKKDYRQRVAHQLKQFSNPSALKKLPPVYQHWISTHIRPRMQEVLGVNNALLHYTENFKTAFTKSNSTQKAIISIGSGDCQLEVSIVERLLRDDVRDFKLVCTDLSEQRLERGKKTAIDRNVIDFMEFSAVDVNTWDADTKFDGIMAHHVLHHVTELERLFESINGMMAPHSCFVTCDIIGRNGHMRWKEALDIIEDVWAFVPDTFKYNHQFEKQHDQFLNWDCSNKGFEGIRAQDILKLLVENFYFENFLGYGNLVDPFIERGYGHNLNVDDPKDIAFIDFLENLNTLLIDLGHLKPTMMMATLRSKPVPATRCFKHWTPEFCIRPVDQE